MNISFHIPEWVFWLLGIPIGLVVLGLAAFGFAVISALSKFRGW